MKIALFTPFNPETGGGGVIFRSIVPHLAGAEIRWFYLANSPTNRPGTVHLGSPLLGGPFIADAISSLRLFVLRRDSRIDEHVATIMSWRPDLVWVNAMNEGLLVGENLLKVGVKHLHVSVHDDPAGLAHKSKRYRLFAPYIDRCNRQLLKRAHSVDVVCNAMQTYYRERVGIPSGVVFRYIDKFELPAADHADESIVTIGHVGSVYSTPEAFAFLNALRSISQKDGTRFRLVNFGKSPAMMSAQIEFPDIVENMGDVPEREIVRLLQKCCFLYSMYSFSPLHRVFRETSQPTKMSTYLMAAKPILAHCPDGSSTTDMLSRFKLGICVNSMDARTIEEGIRAILTFQLEADQVRKAAEYYCGTRNLDFLNSCFGLNLRSASIEGVSRIGCPRHPSSGAGQP